MKRNEITSRVRYLVNSVKSIYTLKRVGRLFLKTKFIRKLPPVKSFIEKKRFYSWATWASPRYKYLYVSVPKVACTKVKQILQEFEGYPVPEDLAELHNRPDRSKPGVPRLSDLSVDEYRAALNSAEWFRFSFVRNPYTRLFSAYKNKIRFLGDPDPMFMHVRDEICKTYGYSLRSDKPAGVVAFRDFVHYVCEAPENRMDAHWAPQTQLLRLDLIKYDFIGRFENFQSDLAQILDRLSAKPEIKERAQTRVNQTMQKYHAPVFDKETASWVYDVYRDDFVLFGYDPESWQFDGNP